MVLSRRPIKTVRKIEHERMHGEKKIITCSSSVMDVDLTFFRNIPAKQMHL
jgi:hypothetical protein